MNRQQITELLQLHNKAAKVLNDIIVTKQDIANVQDRLVLISKDPTNTMRTRAFAEDKAHDQLTELRKLLQLQSEQYAMIAQRLCEPFVPKESYLVTTYEMVSI